MNEGELLQRLFFWLASAYTGGFPLGLAVIVFCLFALPLHDFLNASEVRIRQRGLRDARARFPRLVAVVDDLACRVAKVQPPRLLISPHHSDGAHVLGSFRRGYIVLTEAEARWLERALDSDAAGQLRTKALLLHELAHFANRDIWTFLPLFYFLRAAMFGLSINFWLVLVRLALHDRLSQFLAGALLFAGPDLPKNIPFTSWAAQDATLFFLDVLLLLSSLIMLFFVWRALLRRREVLADAQVITWQGGTQPLLEALLCESVYQTVCPRPSGLKERIIWRWAIVWRSNLPIWKQVRQWLYFHPSLETRCARLTGQQPQDPLSGA